MSLLPWLLLHILFALLAGMDFGSLVFMNNLNVSFKIYIIFEACMLPSGGSLDLLIYPVKIYSSKQNQMRLFHSFRSDLKTAAQTLMLNIFGLLARLKSIVT